MKSIKIISQFLPIFYTMTVILHGLKLFKENVIPHLEYAFGNYSYWEGALLVPSYGKAVILGLITLTFLAIINIVLIKKEKVFELMILVNIVVSMTILHMTSSLLGSAVAVPAIILGL